MDKVTKEGRAIGEAIKEILKDPYFHNFKDNSGKLAHILDLRLKEKGFETDFFYQIDTTNSIRIKNQEPLLSLENALRNTGVPEDAVKPITVALASYRDNLLNHNNFRLDQNSQLSNDAAAKASLHLKQNGYASTSHLAGIASLGLATKALAVNLLPPGLETAAVYKEWCDLKERTQGELEKGKISQTQQDIILDTSKKAIKYIIIASLIPEPTGVISDLTRHYWGEKLTKELTDTGMPEQLAKQYQLSSMLAVTKENIEQYFAELSNKNDIRQLKGVAPLSMALGMPPDQLQQFSAMTEKLKGEALKNELARSSEFKQLENLPAKDLDRLGNLISAGIEPKVSVNDQGEIAMMPQRPILSNDPKIAFEQAAAYIIQSGDNEFKAPKSAPEVVQIAIEYLAKAHQDATHDGDLSNRDFKALMLVSKNLADMIDQSLFAQKQL